MAKSFEKRLKIDLRVHCIPLNSSPHICRLQFLTRSNPPQARLPPFPSLSGFRQSLNPVPPQREHLPDPPHSPQGQVLERTVRTLPLPPQRWHTPVLRQKGQVLDAEGTAAPLEGPV